MIKPPIIVLAVGTSLMPKIGSQTQKIPPKTSVKDNKVRSAAGKFLEHFTKSKDEKKMYPWIHLDIAGTAFLSSKYFLHPKGGTGSGVRLLCEFIKEFSKKIKSK